MADDPRLGGRPDWDWIEAELRPPGEWAQMSEMADGHDLEELSLDILATMLRAALSEAALRALLDDKEGS